MSYPQKISGYDLSCIVKKPCFLKFSKMMSLSINILLFLGVPIFICFKAYEYFESNYYWIIFTVPLLIIIFVILLLISLFLINLFINLIDDDPYELLWRYAYVQLISLFPKKKLYNLINSVKEYNNEVDKFGVIEKSIEAGYVFDTYKINEAIEHLEIYREDLIKSLKTESIFRINKKLLSGDISSKYGNSYSSTVNYQGNQKAKTLLDEMLEDAQLRGEIRKFNEENNK